LRLPSCVPRRRRPGRRPRRRSGGSESYELWPRILVASGRLT
jgi:hypothetical protein